MSDITETATEAVAEVAEEVADQAQHVADAVRSLTKVKVQFAALGAICGAAASAAATYYITVRKLETKYTEIAEESIDEMRQHYQSKVLAAEEKPKLEEIVRERGYGEPTNPVEPGMAPPMAVQPPRALVDEEDEDEEDGDEMVDIPPPPTAQEVRNVFENSIDLPDWDHRKELSRRTPDAPYVIHVDEKEDMSYDWVTLTYYDGDDVLCNERDEIVDPDKRNMVVGEQNLLRFGHGSNDPHIVFVRNDSLEIQYEIVKSPNHYAEEVHGFQHSDYGHERRVRPRFDDEPSG